METSQIPRSFWNSLSFAVVALTMGLLIVGYRASSISIEIANTKINLNQAITAAEQINKDLEAEAAALAAAKEELEKEIARMNANNPLHAKSLELKLPDAHVENIEKSRTALSINKENLQSIRQMIAPKQP